MDAAARVTSKGQITIPKAVREALGDRGRRRGRVPGRGPPRWSWRGRLTSSISPERSGCPPHGGTPRGTMSFVPRAGRGRRRSIDGVRRHERSRAPSHRRSAEHGAAGTAFLGGTSDLLLSDLIVAETVYVLESYYEAPRDQIAESIRSLLAFESIATVSPDVILRAVEIYEIDRLDFAEAYLVACAESTGVNAVASFDAAIDRIDTSRIEP